MHVKSGGSNKPRMRVRVAIYAAISVMAWLALVGTRSAPFLFLPSQAMKGKGPRNSGWLRLVGPRKPDLPISLQEPLYIYGAVELVKSLQTARDDAVVAVWYALKNRQNAEDYHSARVRRLSDELKDTKRRHWEAYVPFSEDRSNVEAQQKVQALQTEIIRLKRELRDTVRTRAEVEAYYKAKLLRLETERDSVEMDYRHAVEAFEAEVLSNQVPRMALRLVSGRCAALSLREDEPWTSKLTADIACGDYMPLVPQL